MPEIDRVVPGDRRPPRGQIGCARIGRALPGTGSGVVRSRHRPEATGAGRTLARPSE